MSLFKVCSVWKTNCGGGHDGGTESYDRGCLLATDLRGEGSGEQQLILGSHSGLLRIFSPISLEGFTPLDLLLEVQLEQPILQLAVGKFVSGSQMDYLAVLHPRRLAVYGLLAVPGSTEHGDQWEVRLAYVEELPKSVYSMSSGGFGGVRGRDFICILCLDGSLLFLEQESLTGTAKLPNFLLPSDIVYLSHTDSFITVSSDWRIQSFRYQSLAEEGPALPSWSYNLGEEVLELHSLPLTTNAAALFLLTQRNFYCFSETGLLKFTKRLNYTPISSHVYSRGEPTVMSLIASDSSHLLVYEDSKLVWAAQLHLAPIALTRLCLQTLPGCLALLSESGELEICYLGTEPSSFVPPPLGSASVTSAPHLEEKLSSLQQQIAGLSAAQKESIGLPLEKKELKLTGKIWESGESCLVEVKLEPSGSVQSASLTIDCPSPFLVSPPLHFIQSINGVVEVSSQVSLAADSEVLATDLSCNLTCTYLSGSGAGGAAAGAGGGAAAAVGLCSAQLHLPLHLVLELSVPSRGLKYCLVFTASSVLNLTSLFTEFRESSWKETGCNEYLAGFSYKGQQDINFSMSLNRSALKYRIETDHLPALTLPVCLLKKKLSGKQLRCGQYSVALPLLFQEVDRNLQIRKEIRLLDDQLGCGTTQMRACQRRLLSKLRDKTPAQIESLSTLIAHSHSYVMAAAHRLEALYKELEENGHLLGNLIKLTMTLIKLTGSASEDEVDSLHEAMANTSHLSEDQGWAEITRVALTHLLKTTLARSIRDQFGRDPEGSIRLKKLIATAIDRVVRGQRPADRGVSPIPEGEDEEGRGTSLTDAKQGMGSDDLKKIIEEAEYNLEHL